MAGLTPAVSSLPWESCLLYVCVRVCDDCCVCRRRMQTVTDVPRHWCCCVYLMKWWRDDGLSCGRGAGRSLRDDAERGRNTRLVYNRQSFPLNTTVPDQAEKPSEVILLHEMSQRLRLWCEQLHDRGGTRSPVSMSTAWPRSSEGRGRERKPEDEKKWKESAQVRRPVRSQITVTVSPRWDEQQNTV